METLGFIVRSQIKIYHKCYPQVCSEQHVQQYLMALGDLSISEFERTECNTTPSSYLCISDLPFCREILYVINYTREPFISWRPADF